MIVWGRRSSVFICNDAGLYTQGEDGTVCGIVDRGGCIGPTRGFRSVTAGGYCPTTPTYPVVCAIQLVPKTGCLATGSYVLLVE